MLARLTSPFREFGWFAGLLYGIDRLLQRLSPNLRLYFYELLVQPITDTPLLSSKLLRGLEIREIRPGSPEIDRMPARPEIKELRFKQKAICLGAFKKHELIGYIWFCFGRYDEDEVRCRFVLPDDYSVFDFDLYVFPEHRMGMGFAGLWGGAIEFLRSRGIEVSFSRLTRVNVASRRAHQWLGVRRVGRMWVLQMWAVELLLATVWPYVHLSARQGNRVRLKLNRNVLPRQAAAAAPGAIVSGPASIKARV